MAQSKTTSSSGDTSVADLTDQIQTLKGDIAKITEILGEIGVEKRDQATAKLRETASEVRAQGERHLRDAQARAEDVGAQAADAVRQQPAAAIGIAVGVGFLIGLVTSRK
ncbi:DUF883 domain-containing protein [Pseudohalocynthiibacter aestuariivivens]|uniref:DUF883 family protein n=1 Tax=Roseovarius pelagicus TaxID=2980108 RepID=A0ABY6DDI7_9RHOB|nr:MULTISPECIES: DUF883 family protein [Rhodobacterales]QIE47330.1 DUF883 domain-containing protein [Pseudohalocynthiibacter aestuariivivens]UXX84109.1 DUF883 family protein [Roseovarius pelagicus]